MSVSTGQVVLYTLNSDDVERINRRRVRGAGHGDGWPAGAQAHVGNSVSIGDIVPLIVVRVWPHEYGANVPGVNGQALLDGNDQLWITSAREGTEPGTWSAWRTGTP